MFLDIPDAFNVHLRHGTHELNVLLSDVLVDLFELVYLSSVALLLGFQFVDFLMLVLGIELFEVFNLVGFSDQLDLNL